MKGIEAEFDLEAADRALCESIAQMLDDVAKTRSPRDRRSSFRLINEMIRTLYARQAAQESPTASMTSSELGRSLARARWSGR
jgi:hypothetical protein